MSESLAKRAQLDELLNLALDDKTVQNLLKEAMKVTDDNNREYGGFIYRSGEAKASVKRFGGDPGSIVLHGSKDSDDAKKAIEKVAGVIIADYLVIPAKNFECIPSQDDIVGPTEAAVDVGVGKCVLLAGVNEIVECRVAGGAAGISIAHADQIELRGDARVAVKVADQVLVVDIAVALAH